MTDRIRSLIVRHATAAEMTHAAIEEGMRPLREDGLAKVRAGETSLTEVARVTDSRGRARACVRACASGAGGT